MTGQIETKRDYTADVAVREIMKNLQNAKMSARAMHQPSLSRIRNCIFVTERHS